MYKDSKFSNHIKEFMFAAKFDAFFNLNVLKLSRTGSCIAIIGLLNLLKYNINTKISRPSVFEHKLRNNILNSETPHIQRRLRSCILYITSSLMGNIYLVYW